MCFVNQHPVSAASLANWSAGRIIDDAVFTEANSLSVTQIQTFLSSKVPTCDTQGALNYTFGGVTKTGAQWAQYWFGPSGKNPNPAWALPPFTCLKDYTENGLSSAQIIYNAAQTYTINPEVLIVLLQKEQGLVLDTWPSGNEYRSATGYGCPDTAVCNSQYYGLTNQIYNAAKMFHAIMTASPSWFTPIPIGSYPVLYSPNAACGSSVVNIQNRATQALYNYTPYQPNQAALNAGYGNGDSCSSYGNRNFYDYFLDWFGNTLGPDYSATIDSINLYGDATYTTPISRAGSKYIIKPGQVVYAKVGATNNGRATWDGLTNLGTANPQDRTSPFYSPGWLNQTRLAHAIGTPTAPYASATFTFQLTAPSSYGIYNEGFNIVQDGTTWLNSLFNINLQTAAAVTQPYYLTGNILPSNSTLTSRQSLVSPDGYSSLYLRPDGLAVMQTDYVVKWTSGIAAGTGARLVMQVDGNLVLYSQSGVAIWNSGSAGNTGSRLGLQDDGNLVIYTSQNIPSWASGTSLGVSHFLYPYNTLPAGGILYKNQLLESLDRKYGLYLQSDGNLVLYKNGVPLWASTTVGSGATWLAMQNDGNLVLYNQSGTAVWNSVTAGRSISNLYMQQDGNLVLYNSAGYTWASNTVGR